MLPFMGKAATRTAPLSFLSATLSPIELTASIVALSWMRISCAPPPP